MGRSSSIIMAMQQQNAILSAPEIASMPEDQWEDIWTNKVSTIRSNIGWDQSSNILRDIVSSGLLRFTDMTNNPGRFFSAHRNLVDPASGFGSQCSTTFSPGLSSDWEDLNILLNSKRFRRKASSDALV